MSLTILSVAPVGSNKASGLYYSCPRMTAALHVFGANVALLTTDVASQYEEKQEYPVFNSSNLRRGAGLAALPAPFNMPDLIHFHSTYIPFHALLARQAQRRNIQYVIAPRGGMTALAQRKKPIKKILGNVLFFNHMVKHAAAIHCLTEQEAVDVRRWGRPVFVVGNGIDLPNGETLARRNSSSELRFVFIGRLDIYMKGLDLLLDACRLVQHELREHGVRIFLYGPDSAGDGAKIERIIFNYQLQDVVTLSGSIHGSAKHNVLCDTDLFLHTSRFEGHPMAVLEALSYGVPCLLTPGTNMSTEVCEAGAGWQAEPDPRAIAEVIRVILARRSELVTKRQFARTLVEREYSWERIGERTLEEYRKILEGNP